VVFALVIAYTLRPLVTLLERRVRLPRWIGALAVLGAVIGALGTLTSGLRDDFASVLDELPDNARRIRMAVQRAQDGGGGSLQQVQKAAKEIEKAAAAATGTPAAATAAVAPPAAQTQSLLVGASSKALLVGSQILVSILLAFFLLAAGDTFRRKLLRLVGPSLAQKRITLEILYDVDIQVQRYLLVLVLTNALLAIANWVLFASMGLQRAELWAAVSGIVHVIPYVGTAVTMGLVAVAAFVQFDDLGKAALIAGGVFVIATAVGMVLTTWMQGRASRMNAVSVFVGVLFFGWLWGAWGMLLAVPLLAVIKSVCDHVEALAPIGDMLGD
jgi:predicted PurR-regulated permease PerM